MNLQKLKKQLESALGYPFSEEQVALFAAHLTFVEDQNKKLNLTSVCDWEAGLVLHIEDSLSALPELRDAPEGELVDLGSGGGFPGIPLAVASMRETTLVEATKKKARVLQLFVQKSNLAGYIGIEALRAEELARHKPGYFSIVTARALASLPALMELAAPLLRLGGVLIAYKGSPSERELEDAASLGHELGMKVIRQRNLVLSDGVSKRTLVQVEKIAEPKYRLPRRNGQSQKRYSQKNTD
jgi:16S rRNA (guanine527-N7)-methyltransferase